MNTSEKDALERLNLRNILLQPQMLQAVQPDMHLVATLLSPGRVIPAKTKDTARKVVRQVMFACTPDLFPGLMAAAIRREDIGLWVAKNGIVAARQKSA